MSQLRALIFDVDGTLAETEEAHRRAFNDTFSKFGLSWVWTEEDYRILLRTTGGKERMRVHADTTGFTIDDALIADIHREKTARYGAILANRELQLRPGIAELIAEAREQGIRLAIATTTNRPNVDALIEATMDCAAGDIFGVIAAGDEVKAKKPAPDVYLAALERLNLPASNCLALEDSRNGLLSATRAGIATIVSPSRYTIGEDFSGAAAVVDDFSEVTGIGQLVNLL